MYENAQSAYTNGITIAMWDQCAVRGACPLCPLCPYCLPPALEPSTMSLFRRLTTLVAAIAGVTAIGCADTPTRVGPREYISDLSITSKVKSALADHPRVRATEVNVETYHGTVQMSGFVNSDAALFQAVQVVRGVKGVTGIKNDMRIR
jgi:BON domain